MLPTTGYFRGLACPDHQQGRCHRPYCHFRHDPRTEPVPSGSSNNSTPSGTVLNAEAQQITDFGGRRTSEKSSKKEAKKASLLSTDSGSSVQNIADYSPEPQEKAKEEEPQQANSAVQSDIFQHLVSEAVKKVLAENPLLAAAGVDPTTVLKSINTSALAAQAAVEVSPPNLANKKKYYPRPPDTPSYNPTPIKELQKRKSSEGKCPSDLGSSFDTNEYSPTSRSAKANEAPGKGSIESETTDFSSDGDDVDENQRKCDFDMLEEVLAEHLQNNKIKVKKKRVKALGKLQYSLTNSREKIVDESSMISDARNMSDQESSLCETPKAAKTLADSQEITESSYFLPPSPIFTSSSDGFGNFNSIVYSKPSTSPEQCEAKLSTVPDEENAVSEKTDKKNDRIERVCGKKDKIRDEKGNSHHEKKEMEKPVKKDLEKSAKKETERASKKEKERSVESSCKLATIVAAVKENPVSGNETKKKAKGHSMLPQVVHSLGAPKMARPSVRSWAPRSTNADAAKDTSDQLEELLQQMDGDDSSNNSEMKDNSKNLTLSPLPKKSKNKTYKVDLDKEIESLTNSSTSKKEEVAGKSISSTESTKKTEDLSEGKLGNDDKKTESTKLKEKKNEKKGNESDDSEESDKVDADAASKKEESASGSESDKDKSDDKTEDSEDNSDSDREKGKYKRKRKRSKSSSSDSSRSHYQKRKKKKKSQKRRKKHGKKRKKYRDQDSESDSDAEGSSKDEANENKSEADDDDDDDQKAESKGQKKHSKRRRKKSKHNKKKYKRKKWKSKSRRRRSRSSTRSRSVSASRYRSNSSKELSPTSSRHRSRSSSLSESQSPKRSRSQNMKRRRSQSTSKSRSQSPRRSRSPRRKKRSRRSKNGSQSPRKDKGDVSSRSHSESGSNRSRSRSQSHSSSKKESPRSESPTQSPSPKGKVGEKLEGESSNMKKKVQDENESKNQSCKSTPSHTDSSKSPSTSPRRKKKRRSRSRSRSYSKSNKSRSRSPQSKKRHNRNRSESPVNRSRSPMTKKRRSRSRSQSSSKRSSKGNSHKQRSRSRSKSRSRSSGKKKRDHRSRSPTPVKKHSRDHINEKNQRSERESKNQSNKSTSSRTSNESEKMKPIPFPVDPSKIKLEKDSLIAHIPVVPDLSIVKTEKEDKEQLSSSSIKDKQSSQTLSSNYLKDKSTHTQSEKASRNNAAEISNNESATVNDKDKEKHKSIREKERRRSHHDKSGVDNASNARSVTEGRSSTDSKRSSERKSVSERKGSTETKDRSLAQESESAKPLSMFDMVAASINPPKPKILKEFSIFDNVAADGHESSSDSPSPSEYDENIDKQNTETASNITQGTLSKSSDDLALKKDKTAVSTPKSERRNSSSSRTEKSNESHKRHHSHSNSGSHKDNKHDAKDDLSSGKKRKSSSHISSTSGSHHSSSSSHHKSNSSNSSSSSQKNSSSSSSHHKSSSSTNKHQDHDTVSSSTNGKSNNSSSKSKEQRPSKSSSSQSSKLKEHKHSHSSSSSSNNLNKKREPGSGSHLKEGKHRSRSRSQSQNEEKKKKKMKASSAEDSSDGISDREAFSPSKDDEGGDESPLPDLSVLDEIPQDDWEQMIDSSSGKFDLKHLENLRNEEEWDLEDLDKDDPEVMEECMKMFNEYQPPQEEQEPQPSTKKARTSKEEEPEYLPGKQRFARSNAIGNLASKKTNAGPNNRKLTPTQVMMERYKKLKEKQAALMKQLKRQKQMLEERGASSSSSSAVSSTTSTKSASSSSSSSTALQSPPHSASGLKRRISHVPNVSSLLHAREKIKNLPPTSTRSLLSPKTAKPGGVLPPTVAHTISKGAKRVAHTPKPEVFVRPIVQAEFGSKVPQNIRQRYLNSFIDECLKFSGEKEAFNLAVAEERVCYKRASSRMVYLNLAVNALKRLRTQQTAGEAAQELLDTDPEFADGATSDEPSSSTKPSTSGRSGGSASPSVSKIDSGHPLNPNHVRLSHFTVLSLGGQKGSWSIEKPKKTSMEHVNANIKGPAFYKHLKKYVLDEEKLGDNGFPIPDPEEKGKAYIKVIDTRKKLSPSAVERFCDRCSVLYTVDKWGFPKSLGPCVHHWGRPYKRRGYGGLETRYSCCGGDLQSEGCSQATTHVSENYDPNNLRGYVRTLPKDTKDSECGVYALDCEMCYTTAGNELTRVTVIDTEGRSVYEQLVKPENPIIDYNTRFSGITESDLEDVKTTIRDVQAAMLTRFSDKTILIGHSLESDFHALKLIHDTVVDTSIVFPHKMGLPYKRALKNLASEYLKKIIQNDVSGHDSAEDAITCMHLMQWRIKEDLKGIK